MYFSMNSTTEKHGENSCVDPSLWYLEDIPLYNGANQPPPTKKSKVHFAQEPMTQEILMENHLVDSDSAKEKEYPQMRQHSFLDILRDLWIDGKTLKIILFVLQAVIVQSTLNEDCEAKRALQVVLGCTKKALKQLGIEVNDSARFTNLSLEKLLDFLLKDELFTTLFEDQLQEDLRKLL